PAWVCKERATTSERKRTAARRVALKLAWGFVARSVEYRCGYTPSSRLAPNQFERNECRAYFLTDPKLTEQRQPASQVTSSIHSESNRSPQGERRTNASGQSLAGTESGHPEIALALGDISVFSVASCSITEYLRGKERYEPM